MISNAEWLSDRTNVFKVKLGEHSDRRVEFVVIDFKLGNLGWAMHRMEVLDAGVLRDREHIEMANAGAMRPTAFRIREIPGQ